MARAKEGLGVGSGLYERDFYAWTEEQAALLKAGDLERLDRANLIEEIEDLGRSQKSAIKNNLVVVLMHLLKYQFQAARRNRSWMASIVEHRQRLRDDFEDSPSLERHAERIFERAYADARRRAMVETGLASRRFPEQPPYTLQQALDLDFLPD